MNKQELEDKIVELEEEIALMDEEDPGVQEELKAKQEEVERVRALLFGIECKEKQESAEGGAQKQEPEEEEVPE